MSSDVSPAGQPAVRAVTVGVAAPHPLSEADVVRAASLAHRCGEHLRSGGYDTQTIRISTRPVFDDLSDATGGEIADYTGRLARWLAQAGIDHCSLGPADAARPGSPLDRIDLIPDLLIGADALSCSVLMANSVDGVRYEAAGPVARTIRRLGLGTAEGLGNFRFAMLACVGPGAPFFPAAYHNGPDALSVGLQSAGVVRAALAETGAARWASASATVARALELAAGPIAAASRRFCATNGLRFGGVDLSPAPAPTPAGSIGAAIESISGAPFGEPGTLAAIGAITAGVRAARVDRCGFSGLMLPVLEDVVLARRWAERRVTSAQLLAYSAVCGTGLDTVPLPGDIDVVEIERLMLDVAALAVRWNKPLSARLFPVRGRKTGESTSFTSPYLVNSVIGI